jgi:predicted SprT family Zn-dependent metalloprotease
MEINAAKQIALRLMGEHRLLAEGWSLHIGTALRTFGSCGWEARRITLSGPLIALNDAAEVRDTILHEIAHALAGRKAGHGRVWQLMALAVGARPQRCYSAKTVRVPPWRWRFACPTCGHTGTRLRKPARRLSCGRCAPGRFDAKYVLRWTDLHAAAAEPSAAD